MSIKAILFDMDGVLIDAKEWHYEALNKALEPFGVAISRSEHISTYDGLPTSQKLLMLSDEKGLPREMHAQINAIKQQYTCEMMENLCKPNLVHQHALASLKKLGYKLAVCSNSIKSTVNTMVQKAGLESYLELQLSNEDVSTPKPSPEIYTRAMNYFQLEPYECLIVEDNENGIKAAQAAGGHLLVINGVHETNFDNIISTIQRINQELN